MTENPPPYRTTCSPPLHPVHCTVYVANIVHMYEWHINHAEFNEHASHPCPGPLERGIKLPPPLDFDKNRSKNLLLQKVLDYYFPPDFQILLRPCCLPVHAHSFKIILRVMYTKKILVNFEQIFGI